MRKLVLLLCVALAASGCSAQAGSQTSAAPEAAPVAKALPATDTLARIRALVGSPACSTDAQCHTLPLGAKPCGGPAGYLAWSSAHTAEAELRALGEAYQQEQRAANSASGMMSTCSLVPDPGAICKTGICQLGSGAAAQAR